MVQVISRKFNSLKLGDVVKEGDKTYKVTGIAKYVNEHGGTDYVVEDTTRLVDKIKGIFKK